MNRCVAFAIIAGLFLVPGAAYAYCLPASPPYYTGSTIRVRIHDNLDENMRHADGTVWTRLELEMAVERVLLRLNSSVGANTPWVYLDTETLPSTCAWLDTNCGDGINNPNIADTCALANTIHLVPVNCGATWWYTTPLGSTAQIIQIERSLSGIGDMRWEHFPGAAAQIFEFALLHELGHALGLVHPMGCSWSTVCPSGSNPCAVMAGDWGQSGAGEYFMQDDSDALRSSHGTRTAPAESLFEAYDLDAGFVPWSIGNVNAMGFFAASSRPTGAASRITIVGYGRTWVTSPYAYDWDWASFGLTSLGAPNLQGGNGPLGIAHDGANRLATSSVWRFTPNSRKWRRRVGVSTRAFTGSTWSTALSNPTSGALDDTVAGGVSSAYEPRTAVLVTAFRASDGRVLLQDSSGSTFGTPFNTTIKSITTPLIACTTASAPTKNCILVTVDPGRPVSTSTTQRLQWTEFSWNASANTWVSGSLHTEPWLMWSDMSLAVHSDGSSWEFVVTYQIPTYTTGGFGYETYVLRKAPGEGNGFALWGKLTESSQQTSFSVVGATGGYVDSFHFLHP